MCQLSQNAWRILFDDVAVRNDDAIQPVEVRPADELIARRTTVMRRGKAPILLSPSDHAKAVLADRGARSLSARPGVAKRAPWGILGPPCGSRRNPDDRRGVFRNIFPVRRAESLLLYSTLALFVLALFVRFCVAYHTDEECDTYRIVVLDRPRWDAIEPKNRLDQTSLVLMVGDMHDVSGEELAFSLGRTGWLCSLFTVLVTLVLRRAYVRASPERAGGG